MRNIKYLFMTLVAIAFISCKDESNTDLTLSPTSVNLYRDNTQQITVVNSNSYITWSSSDEFVAGIENGLVTARHIGKATIKASSGKATGICSVTVKPEYNLYDEPNTNWGATKQQIKNIYGTPSQEQDKALAYLVNEDRGILVMYMFDDNGKLTSAGVTLNLLNNGSVISQYLLERYQPYGKTGNYYVFGNKMEMDDASLIVSMDFETNSYILVLYMPNTYKSNAPRKIKSQQEELKSIIDKFSN